MNSKEANKALKKGFKKMVFYLLISIPLAFLFIKVIELKYTKIFWIFMLVTGISGFFAEWFIGYREEEKSQFIKVAEHLTFIGFIILVYVWIYFVYFSE